jgi:hypothetical protein
VTAKFHFTEDAFALHLFLERLQRLIDIIVANQNLHAFFPVFDALQRICSQKNNDGSEASPTNSTVVSKTQAYAHRRTDQSSIHLCTETLSPLTRRSLWRA